jgi:serine protease Do
MIQTMKPIVFAALVLIGANHSFAEEKDVPFMSEEEGEAVAAQSQAFNEALTPALKDAAKSVVRLWSQERRLAYGTVVGDGSQILSKWSEVAKAKGGIIADAGENDTREVSVVTVYQDDDLVLMKIQGKPLTPVKWSLTSPQIGDFTMAPQPDGHLAAFGVVSVLERNLRETDTAFLGIGSDSEYRGEGVKITEVSSNTGAEAAGLKSGDIILKVGDRSISGLLELKNALTGVTPGSKIPLLVRSTQGEKRVEVMLGNRPNSKQYKGPQLQMMERMGGAISQKRDSFTLAIQSDMRPGPTQIGGPVVNLQGQVIGMTLARADRTRTFIMPAAAVSKLLKSEGVAPAIAMASQQADLEPKKLARDSTRPGQAEPSQEERMIRHLSDMQRLMDHMRSEMMQLEEP